jgi:hypothetical protein
MIIFLFLDNNVRYQNKHTFSIYEYKFVCCIFYFVCHIFNFFPQKDEKIVDFTNLLCSLHQVSEGKGDRQRQTNGERKKESLLVVEIVTDRKC